MRELLGLARRRLLIAAGTAATALRSANAWAQKAAAPSPEALLAERLRHEGLGLVAAVADGNAVRFAAAGRRTLLADDPLGPDVWFEYGSITKTFTALLLADKVVRGDLKLDGAVEAVLPDGLKLRDSAGAPITWADLATHRSGLPRLPDNLRDAGGVDPYDYTRRELLTFLAAWKPTLPRDTQWEYSNLGYGLLGEALALHARVRFDALLHERVLQPLGLADHMRLALRGTPLPGLLPGHDGAGRAVPNWRFDAMAGAGALAGTARGLARYAMCALGTIDNPLRAAFDLALAHRADGPGARNPIALAWLAAPLDERTVFNHDGGTAGYASSLWLDPGRRRAALVLANAQVGLNDLALHLLEPRAPLRDIAAEKRASARPAAAVAPEQLAALAGRYAINPQFKVEVRTREGRLFAQATGQGEFELFALDARRFFARIAPLEIHFEGNGSASPPAFVLHQGGQQQRFVRE